MPGPAAVELRYLLRRREAFVHISPAMHRRGAEPLCEIRLLALL